MPDGLRVTRKVSCLETVTRVVEIQLRGSANKVNESTSKLPCSLCEDIDKCKSLKSKLYSFTGIGLLKSNEKDTLLIPN